MGVDGRLDSTAFLLFQQISVLQFLVDSSCNEPVAVTRQMAIVDIERVGMVLKKVPQIDQGEAGFVTPGQE